jgi:hypothetical protein
MADKDNSLESGSDKGVEKRDYPGNFAPCSLSQDTVDNGL